VLTGALGRSNSISSTTKREEEANIVGPFDAIVTTRLGLCLVDSTGQLQVSMDSIVEAPDAVNVTMDPARLCALVNSIETISNNNSKFSPNDATRKPSRSKPSSHEKRSSSLQWFVPKIRASLHLEALHVHLRPPITAGHGSLDLQGSGFHAPHQVDLSVRGLGVSVSVDKASSKRQASMTVRDVNAVELLRFGKESSVEACASLRQVLSARNGAVCETLVAYLSEQDLLSLSRYVNIQVERRRKAIEFYG